MAELLATRKRLDRYSASTKTEDRIQARKHRQRLAEGYWTLLFALLDAQMASFPEELFFDESERLFIDFGYLGETLTPRNAGFDLDAALNSRAVAGVFPYVSFSDYIAETWAAITDQYLPAPYAGADFEGRLLELKEQLRALEARRDSELVAIAERDPGGSPIEAERAAEALGQYLMSFCKVSLRTKEYREAPEDLKQTISQERFRYLEAEKRIGLILHSAQKVPEIPEDLDLDDSEAMEELEAPLSALEAESFMALHEATKTLGKKLVYVYQDEEKILRNARRISDACSQFTELMMRRELKNVLMKKKEYLAVPAKTARCETSLLCPQSDAPVLYDQVSQNLEALADNDMNMFSVARIRMYGIPQAIFVPGQGFGTYDWLDHTLLLPVFPFDSLEKSLLYALGTFRWDSDEDRILKNIYENLKEHRRKSILDMASSFYKDYFLWMSKEKQGYRVLPRETHKAFTQMFAPRDADA